MAFNIVVGGGLLQEGLNLKILVVLGLIGIFFDFVRSTAIYSRQLDSRVAAHCVELPVRGKQKIQIRDKQYLAQEKNF